MRHHTVNTLALTLCLPVLVAASPVGREFLASQALSGFEVGYEAGNDQVSIREEVPSGETVENWTRMVTTQRFAGAAARVTPLQVIQTMAQGLTAACPGGSASRPASSTRNGQPAAQFRADCPLLAQTGKPETFIALVIAGPADIHVKQVAFRRVPSEEDVRWAEGILTGVVLCGAGEPSPDCTR